MTRIGLTLNEAKTSNRRMEESVEKSALKILGIEVYQGFDYPSRMASGLQRGHREGW